MDNIKQILNELNNKGQYRSIPKIQDKQSGKIVIDGVTYINLASNDYLGIGTNRDLQKEFLSTYNSDLPLFSSASARLLTGSSIEFTELEQTLAKLFKKESCLIFNTGYQCNLGVISSLIGHDDIVFSDKLNHASIIDGMKLSDGNFVRYKHNDYEHLETLLKTKRNKYKRALIVSESLFSMDGDCSNIDKLIELKAKYNCLLMIDEAHAFATIGKDLNGLTANKDVDIITATFGKALGSFGAFCVANKEIIEYLVNKSRSFIFSTSIPPFIIAWTNWLLTSKRDYLLSTKARLNELSENVHKLLNAENPSSTHIIPILIGTNEKTSKVAEILRSKGFYIPAIRPPTVPEGTSRLRLSLTADIKLENIETALDIIKTVL